jgi:hypothetical protein
VDRRRCNPPARSARNAVRARDRSHWSESLHLGRWAVQPILQSQPGELARIRPYCRSRGSDRTPKHALRSAGRSVRWRPGSLQPKSYVRLGPIGSGLQRQDARSALHAREPFCVPIGYGNRTSRAMAAGHGWCRKQLAARDHSLNDSVVFIGFACRGRSVVDYLPGA